MTREPMVEPGETEELFVAFANTLSHTRGKAHDDVPDTDALLDWLRPRCANFRMPRRLWLVEGFEAIGMTASGKVQKTRLRAHALALLSADAAPLPSDR